MRATTIAVHNNQSFEVFIRKREGHFEIWTVGPFKGQRTVLDHHLTHDDVEPHLGYAKAGDLAWRDADPSEIPTEKHRNAVEAEETIQQGTFWDYENWPEETGRSVARHFGSISFINDKKEFDAAKKLLLGRWTDGVATLDVEPGNRLRWSCEDRNHPLNIGERVHGHAPDWWRFENWRLHLMNAEHKCGTHVGVLHVDEKTLHLEGAGPHRLVHIFRRA